jgi:hypothetical protein
MVIEQAMYICRTSYGYRTSDEKSFSNKNALEMKQASAIKYASAAWRCRQPEEQKTRVRIPPGCHFLGFIAILL